MRILINTFTTNNLGQRLQNYALQEVLKKYGQVYTLYHKVGERRDGIEKFLAKCKHFVGNNILTLLSCKRTARKKNFKHFDKKITFESKIDASNELKINEYYDYIVFGSDQIWNSEFSPIKLYLYSQIDKEKKIAYAASVGKSTLTELDKHLFEKNLDNFKAVSVREKTAENLLQPLTHNKIQTLLDPTFLLSSTDWQKVERAPKIKPSKRYIFLYMLGNISSRYREFINNISKKYDLEIVDVFSKKSKYSSCGPAEFLYLIRNSSIVMADSFHAIVFSIINRRPFIHLEREDNVISMSSRMENLERIFNTKFSTLDDVNIDDENDLFSFKLQNVDKLLEVEQRKAHEFLDNAFKPIEKNNNLYDFNFNCAGCGLCASICPKGAISYKTNSRGFLRPVINEDKCIHCGLCSKNCVMLRNFDKQSIKEGIFSANNKNPKNDNSSSAGVFGEIATNILNSNGIVYAVKYDKDKSEFIRVTNLQELEKVKGSKYFQVDISNQYKNIEKDLKNKKVVLVCGTPCQIAGLKTKFEKYENLVLVKFLCHGVPSQQLFKDYCMQEYNQLPEKLNCRKKNPIWGKSICELSFKDKTILENNYLNIFLSDFDLNDCCYDCHFAGKQVGADLTIGDAWNIQKINEKMYSPNGVSLIIPHTEKGLKVFKNVKENFNTYMINENDYSKLQDNVFKAFNMKNKLKYREVFYSYLDNNSILDSYKKVYSNHNSFVKRALRKAKRICKKILCRK